MDINTKAAAIVAGDPERSARYGPFSESMERASRIATELLKRKMTAEDMYKCMVAFKLARLAHSLDEDTMLDICAYLGKLNEICAR